MSFVMRVENYPFEGGAPQTSEVLHLVSDVVAAYVSNNNIDPTEISPLIHQVYATLTTLGNPGMVSHLRPLEPAVPIKKSITDDHIICLEDGKKLKMLKRHLRAVYKMTPEQYRERWGLPIDYPMVAPNYAKKRSSLAKINGLGYSNKKDKKRALLS
jgi:predicted transcriptional regulator